MLRNKTHPLPSYKMGRFKAIFVTWQGARLGDVLGRLQALKNGSLFVPGNRILRILRFGGMVKMVKPVKLVKLVKLKDAVSREYLGL